MQSDDTNTVVDSCQIAWSTIPDMFRASCEQYARDTALVDGKTRITFSQLREHVNQMSCALHGFGVVRNDKVCLWAENSWRWVVCALAVWHLGAVVVPISSRLKAKEAGPIISQAGARLLITLDDCAGHSLSGMLATEYGVGDETPFKKLPNVTGLICLDDIVGASALLGHSYSYDEFLTFAEGITFDEVVCNDIRASDLSEVLYTSGTTGEPKGVMLGHQQILQSFWDWSGLGGLQVGDKFMVIPPFSHGFGINAGILACLMRGTTHIVVPIFNPDDVFRWIQTESISVMSGPPALFSTLMNRADLLNFDLSSLRVAYVGAATVPTEIIHRMRDVLGFDRVINAYGLIEACAVTMTREDDCDEVVSKTVGSVLPGVSLRIVDEQGYVCVEGVSGEIQIKGANVMLGYFDDETRSSEVINADRWLSTGDLGALDDQGNLRILGRKKEMYICNGFNVYPAEVESLLLQIEGIAQLAVVGVDDDQKGEVGVAFIVLKNDAAPSSEQVRDWASKNMAAYKVPQRVIIKESLPLNVNGKVIKDELKKLALRY